MDVKKLTQEPSGKVRGMLATKLAMDYRSGNFSDSESDIAVDIFRILLRDVEKKVRKTLSEQLSHCPNVPRDIVLKLVNDEPDIAAPMLQFSSVLTEDDLIAVVRSTKEVLKLSAVARREDISENLSNCILDTHNEQVLNALFSNASAHIPEKGMLESWQYISSSRTLLEILVKRGGLPITIAEKVYFLVADELKRQLVKQYKLNSPLAAKASVDAREWEMLGIIPEGGRFDPSDDEDVSDLIDQLHLGGRLTHSLLIRALCVGSLSVFEAGIARLAGVPRVNARILLMDGGALGFQAIYKAAGMPEGFADAIQVLLKISLEVTDFGQVRYTDFRRRVIDQIYIQKLNRSVENMEYLLTIIGGRIAATA
jgi:uncharacterized protein (DUF2336 family)